MSLVLLSSSLFRNIVSQEELTIKQVLSGDYMLNLWPHRLLQYFVSKHFWTYVGYYTFNLIQGYLNKYTKFSFSWTWNNTSQSQLQLQLVESWDGFILYSSTPIICPWKSSEPVSISAFVKLSFNFNFNLNNLTT